MHSMHQLFAITRPQSVQSIVNEFLECGNDVKRSRSFWKLMRQKGLPPSQISRSSETGKSSESHARIEKIKGHGSIFSYIVALAIGCLAVLAMMPYYLSLTLVWFGLGVGSALYLQQSGVKVPLLRIGNTG